MWYNYDTINQIAIQVDANDIFNGMTPIIDISIATSVSISLTNRFDGIKLKLGKVSEYECGYVNNVNTITTTNTWYKIHIVTFTVKLFLTTIYFIRQSMDMLMNIIISIEFDVIVVVVNQLVLILAIQASIAAVDSNKQIICNVCAVFNIFSFFWYLYSFVFWSLWMQYHKI